MRKLLFAFLTIVGSCYCATAQSTSDLGVWLDHLPYGNGIDVECAGNQVYCACRQGIFIYDTEEKSVQRLSKVNGLTDVGLSTIAWSDQYQTLLVGYEDGNLDLLKGEKVTNVSDIKQSGNYSGLKHINHIEVSGNTAYICTDFGIVSYDLDKRIFEETYIIGDGGKTLKVNDLVLTNDSIFAATPEGLLGASLSKPLLFYANWKKDPAFNSDINQVDFFNGHLVVNEKGSSNDDKVYQKVNGSWQQITQIDPGTYNDLRVSKNILLMTNSFSVRGYDKDFNMIYNIQASDIDPQISASFQAAVLNGKSQLFLIDDGNGMYFRTIYDNQGNAYYTHVLPNSPDSKNVLSMYHNNQELYVAPGAITAVWAPDFNNDGYFSLKNYEWTNHPNSEFNNYRDIVAAITDPADPNHLYLSSYGNGILEFQDGQYKGIINEASTNSAFPSVNQTGGHRVGGFAADPDGNIWFTNGLTDKPLGVIHPDGSIESYSLGAAASSATAFKKIVYTTNDQIWMQTRTDGIVVVNAVDKSLPAKRLVSTEGSGNLPTNNVLSFAEDLDGEMWIGTDEGMTVLYSPQNIFEPGANYDAQIIVIDEDGDGNGDRVLGSEEINDIAVDGSNKKWFATANSGVFYTSENGHDQIYHFTKDNSPLPSNNVLDIEIDDITGMVYFGTDQGIVSFQGAATKGAEYHTDVFAYPNPVKPGYTGPILIRGLVTNAQVKITDIEGNLIYQTVAEGGQAIWSGKNFDGRRARSGVYIAYITNDDGTVTAVTKILIVN